MCRHNCVNNIYLLNFCLSVSLLYHTSANKSMRKPCMFSMMHRLVAIWCICFTNMMLLHFVPQWCDVCLKMWRSHTSLGEAVIIGRSPHHLPKANIIEKSHSRKRMAFFLCHHYKIDPYKAIVQKQSVNFAVRVHLSLDDDGSWQ